MINLVEESYNRNKTRKVLARYAFNNGFKKKATVILLNPTKEYSGLKKLATLLNKHEYGEFQIVYLYPVVTQKYGEFNPKKVGVEALHKNYLTIENSINSTDDVIVAWGSHENAMIGYITVTYLIYKANKVAFCFGVNRDMNPRDPEFLPLNTPLLPYLGDF